MAKQPQNHPNQNQLVGPQAQDVFGGDKTWQCYYCQNLVFKTSNEFTKHLRERHCSKEGGSFVCRYGYNGVCASLPLDGVNDRDYETHVMKYHVNQVNKGPEQWSVFSAAQNLPAVLNDPSRGKQTNLFTKKWGDSFVERTSIAASQHLADINWSHFEGYVRRIGKRYRRHARLMAEPTQYEQSQAPSPSSSTSHHQNHLDDATLNDIPPIFLKQSFELYNQTTFNSVFPGVGDDDDGKKHSDRLLQEKLSHYLDIVEVHIAKQVSQKSSAFFHAMTSQDTIMEEMNSAAINVKSIRQKIRNIDETVVRNALKIISMQRTRTNYHLVLEKLKLMRTVHQTQPTIQLLLSTQDYVAALDLIGTTQEILSQELAGVHCFRHLPSQLNEMENLIDKMLTTDFERYSTAELNRPMGDHCDGDDVKSLEEDKLACIVSGLMRKKNFIFLDTFRDEAITTTRAAIKQMVIEIIATSDAEVCLTGSGEESQILSFVEWIILLENASETLLKILKRIKNIHNVIEQTANISCGNVQDSYEDAFLTEDDFKSVKSKLTDLLISTCNYCHERCAHLVAGQSLEKSTPTIGQINELSTIVERFTRGCEEICGVVSVPLSTALKSHANKFAQKFHAERKSKLALLLDSERWKQADVPAEFQKIINNILHGDFVWTKTDDGINMPPSPVLIVDGEPYALVGAALLLVQIVTEYCRCAIQLPIVASSLSRSIVDLLRTFNSRCCQLVLGAGALHVAGLKTITSSNLALVSRALQLVLWLLPKVKTHFQSFESNGTATLNSGYETVEKDFISHIKEIENKVLSIVCSIVVSQLSNWDARPPVPSQSFRNISRQFVKLHEAIAPILPDQQVHTIYRTVHKHFKDKLREQLLKNNIVNNCGPQHGVVTSELTFYLETLRTLKAMPENEMTDETMEDIWL